MAHPLDDRIRDLEAVFDALPIAVFVAHDTGGNCITGNRAGHALLRKETDPGTPLSFVSENGHAKFRQDREGLSLDVQDLPVYRAAQGEPVRDFEFSLTFTDGTVRDVSADANPLRDENGDPCGCVMVLRDVTQQKLHEVHLRSFVTQAPAAIAMFDRNLFCLTASER